VINLERINTNFYNKYQNKLILIKNYKISIQCNANVNCKPKQNLLNPNSYEEFELIVFDKDEPIVPMGYKEYFDKDGIAKNVNKVTIEKILRYINSDICMMMEIGCL